MEKYLVQSIIDPSNFGFYNEGISLKQICEDFNGEFEEDFFEGSEDENDENYDGNYHKFHIINLESRKSDVVKFEEGLLGFNIEDII